MQFYILVPILKFEVVLLYITLKCTDILKFYSYLIFCDYQLKFCNEIFWFNDMTTLLFLYIL